MEIKNKTIVVTGGASGLGEATARSFLKAGANVVIFDLNDDNANKIISELGSENIKYINVIRAHPKNLYQIFLQILAIFGCFLQKYHSHYWW